MNLVTLPAKDQWPVLLQRPVPDRSAILAATRAVLEAVRLEGDAALIRYTEKFDGVKTGSLLVTADEVRGAGSAISDTLKQAMETAVSNIRCFHEAQKRQMKPVITTPGVVCWQKTLPVEKIGLYIPGGSAPLFSTLLMLATPAQIAGCKEIILCTPPGKKQNGSVHPAVLHAAMLCGVTSIYKAGGAQAIAAMAYGTESVPKVDKIFGPGNAYVTAAKQLVQLDGVAIDLPAGPSELCVLADDTANPEYIAADLLAQAEHGPDSQVLLVTDSTDLAGKVSEAVIRQLTDLPRQSIAEQALGASRIIVVHDLDEGVELVNVYAPEHLLIICREEERMASMVRHAGSVFLGPYTPESLGDYASGTNHTLPTDGYARVYSGVGLDHFCKTISFQRAGYEGLQNLGPAVITMAEAEGLTGHARSVSIRLTNHN